jgi:hypothetical protein
MSHFVIDYYHLLLAIGYYSLLITINKMIVTVTILTATPITALSRLLLLPLHLLVT